MAEQMYPLGNEVVKISRSGNVAIVTMSLPERKNAFNLKMRHGLINSFRQLMYFDDCRAIVLTGEGGAFCAGGDITEMRKRTTMEIRERIDLVSQLTRIMLTGPKPIISAVEGPAFGAGWSMALASDYIVAAKDSKFCAAFIRVGLVPDTGIFWSLLQRVSRGATAMSAREMLEIATLGGARVLGRDDIGALAPGMACDLIAVRLDEPGLAGAGDDPVAALLLCQVARVALNVVQGRVLVRAGQLVTLDEAAVVARQRKLSKQLLAA